MPADKLNRNHYVPQCYLRQFSFNKNKIYVFDKERDEIFFTNITNVACKGYFYDFPETDTPINPYRRRIEKLLSKFEQKYSYNLKHFISEIKVNSCFDPEYKEFFSPFIFIQSIRTDLFREGAKFGLKTAMNSNRSSIKNYINLNSIQQGDLIEQFSGLIQVMYMQDQKILNEFVDVFKNFIWFVGINQTANKFWTSDHPVLRMRHEDHNVEWKIKYFSKNSEWVLPLTPEYILIILHPKFFENQKIYDCKADLINPLRLDFYNEAQVCGNNRQIFSNLDNLHKARDIFKRGSKLVNPYMKGNLFNPNNNNES